MRTRPPHGFTLIELMIVVAIVAILAMVAMPAYDSYIRRSVRVEAQGYNRPTSGEAIPLFET